MSSIVDQYRITKEPYYPGLQAAHAFWRLPFAPLRVLRGWI